MTLMTHVIELEAGQSSLISEPITPAFIAHIIVYELHKIRLFMILEVNSGAPHDIVYI